MKNIYFLLIIILLIISCKKKNFVSDPKIIIDKVTELKNYKIISKKRINDSIEELIGENQFFTIRGALNKKRNKKTDWWIVRKKNSSNVLRIQYLIFGNQLFKNQIIFLNKNTIDTLSSKFYSIRKENDSLKFYFHSPRNRGDVFVESFLKYKLLNNRKVLKSDSVAFADGNGNYHFSLDLKTIKKNTKFGGYFTEYSTQKIKKDSMSISYNTIYIFDEINL